MSIWTSIEGPIIGIYSSHIAPNPIDDLDVAVANDAPGHVRLAWLDMYTELILDEPGVTRLIERLRTALELVAAQGSGRAIPALLVLSNEDGVTA